MKLAADPVCEQCLLRTQLIAATAVHQAQPDLGLDMANLESLCADCHHAIDKTRTRW
jgi:hypothetical protein